MMNDNNTTTTTSTIQAFGERIMNVWRELRPATRSLVERALTANAAAQPQTKASIAKRRMTPYDAPAEAELSRLLRALDERLAESATRREGALDPQQRADLRRMIKTCAGVLQTAAQSAESFAQLLQRALHASDYVQVDALADSLPTQLSPTEICELARDTDRRVRAIAGEALALVPVSLLVELLADPVDAEQARAALHAQAHEFGSEEARWVIEALSITDDDVLED